MDKIALAWEKMPLIPVVAQDSKTSQILMLAYVNKEALEMSLKSGEAHYFSRSKNRIWRKGEESGNIQKIEEIRVDCDNDALIFIVNQSGAACHTGEPSCFFKKIDMRDKSVREEKTATKKPNYHVLDELYHVLQERKRAPSEESYTSSLYQKGENTIGKKIAEEAAELAFALKDNNRDEIIYECADVLYHALVGLSYRDVEPDLVMRELRRRFGMSGILEKKARKDFKNKDSKNFKNKDSKNLKNKNFKNKGDKI